MPRTRLVAHELPSSRLVVAERALDARSAAFVESRYGYEEHATGALARGEFATPSVVVILEIGAPLAVGDAGRAERHPGGFVAGLTDAPTRTEHAGHQAGVQLNLSALAARLVLQMPLRELAHRVVAAADVLPRSQRDLPQRLGEAASWDARLDAVDAFAARAADAPRPAGFAELSWAVAQLERRAGGVRIAALARALGWSERRLERAFGEQLGVSPKAYARLLRFAALMARVQSGRARTWAEAAAALGYADQSHLVRDVRQFAGVPPSAAESQLLAVGRTAT